MVIRDLGCGTGAMARWLAERLTGPQQWFLYDWDADLLALAARNSSLSAADGAPVTIETRRRDVTRLEPSELAGASLLTASALLDVMTADELKRLVSACAGAGCPALITLTVTGAVELTSSDPFDEWVADAFNAHQRRVVGSGRLLGPEAVAAAVGGFTSRGYCVLVRSSPWRLGPAQAGLAAEWFAGWLAAACQQRPELQVEAVSYARQRLAAATAGRLGVTVQHQDLLADPRGS